ncbi:MAG: LamG domain-containing protein [Planctomycetota bacterium]
MCIMIDHWGTDEPLCDIGPMPWGDGVVDVEDLKVLADYIGENVIDGTLIAHWALDEAEGVIARDGARDNDGTVIGTCAWQPIDGQVNGALALDGTTSIVADRVLNPADGPFSVLAWIKGGAPGQVIISQAGGENWLMVDAETGTLATDLVSPTRRFAAPALISDTVLTDDIWHRIGFVWDGTSRALYVDDVLVAEDFQDALAGCLGDMNIGCDKDMTPGTFWEGLIDDVRIYNRAVRP